MHEDRVLVRGCHHRAVDLERPQRRVAAVRVIVAHRHPDISHHAIGAVRRLKLIVAHLDVRALRVGPGEKLRRRREILGRGDPKLEAEPCRSMNPGGGDIIGVSDPGNCAAFDRTLQLLEGHDVGHDLAGMGAASEPVDHRHGRMGGELDKRRVRPGAEHDHIDIARQHAGSIGDGLAAAELHVLRIEHDGGPAELVHGDLEGDARPGRGLLEDHGEHGALARADTLRSLSILAFALDGGRVIDDRAQGLCVQCVDV